ncbi:MAG: Zn-dependent hydrolase [Solirubrobacteraceae bacterium]|nr:Zn-dependent hydrolase [Solirubrobacteraceae bacterium]
MDEVEASTARILADVMALTEPAYTRGGPGLTRHAYTEEYANTLAYFRTAFEELGYDVWFDPVGTLVASNRPPGAPAFGLGSHCDANRNGGPWDGTLGVVGALEVCRLAAARGMDLPLRVFAFMEEEGSGFEEMLLGSRIMAGDVTAQQLAALRDENGVDFFTSARAAGYAPERFEESPRELDGLFGWIELHIEQGRTLQDEGLTIGVVDVIAGMVHADVIVTGRPDHAGGTAMRFRSDPLLTAAEIVLEVEALTTSMSDDAVGTVGEFAVHPNLVNVIPGEVTFSLDMRSGSGDHLRVLDELLAFAQERAASRGQAVEYRERVRVTPSPMDPAIVATLANLCAETGVAWRTMPSGGGHDTMRVVPRIPGAMVFVPCRDGISHAPDEDADPAHAALACQLILAAVERLSAAALTPGETA